MQTYEGTWRKRLLIPSWVLQIACAAIMSAANAIAVAGAEVVKMESSKQDLDDTFGPETMDEINAAEIFSVVLLAFSILTLVLVSVEIVLYKRQRLTPAVLLCFAVAKSVVWSVYMVVAGLSIGNSANGYSILSLVLCTWLLAASVQQAVVAGRSLRQQRRANPSFNAELGQWKATRAESLHSEAR